MKLKTIEITNFRGIDHVEINFENFTTIIGSNNIGKSTILNAINLVLDNKKPKIDDFPNREPSDKSMEIICTFDELEEWEKNKSSILLHEDKLFVKMSAIWKDIHSDINYEYSVYCTEYSYPWSKFSSHTQMKSDSVCKGVFEALGVTKATEFKERLEEIISYVEEAHPDLINSETDWHVKKWANSLQQAVPHVMYVPASFKIEDDLKSTNNSPFSFLFSNSLFPIIKKDDTYNTFINNSSLLKEKLKSKDENKIDELDLVLSNISKSLNEILDFESKVNLSMGDIDIEPIFKKAATLLIENEIETSLNYQGSGVQRALAFAILEANANSASQVKDGKRTVIVLYEEPELYIHPHLMRRLRDTLRIRSNESAWQVICTTHSPFVINIADNPASLKILKRNDNKKRIVNEISSDVLGDTDREKLRGALDFNPSLCEAFFSKRVVVVEGDTEIAVFSMVSELSEKLNINLTIDKDTTVISAGGKWTIPSIIKVLNGLGIDYRVIHDTDRKGLTDAELAEKKAIHPFKANAKILEIAGPDRVFLVEDTFEHILWDLDQSEKPKSSDKPYHSWKRVKDYLNGELILTDKSETTLKEMIEFAFVE